jgi:phosphoribosylformimino-5-aminoimidazole carboxamide ribotide isomerase
MLLIPAIDLKDGKCVRLRQGRMDEATIYSDDPVEVAARWVAAGARRLHLVDLDGAMAGKPVNDSVIRHIVSAFPETPVQVGGGIRDRATVERVLAAGVRFVILGTQAVRDPEQVDRLCQDFPQRIVVGLDARAGAVATEGWTELSEVSANQLAKRFEGSGVVAIVYTEISRDGMLSGIDLERTVALAEAVSVPVIASGGVASLDDIHALCAVEAQGVSGAIVGRALYEGTLDFAEAQQLADGGV